jgi:RNA polymerase sigma-70 factor (ECF subfamily)
VDDATPVAEPQKGDDELVTAARTGDADAFAALYRRFARTVRGILLARLPYQEVPDAIQDVFLSAWSHLAELREPSAFGAWLASIARNSARHLHRARIEVREPVDVAVAPSTDAFELMDAIRALPEAYRETLLLRLVEDLGSAQIAARTGLTEGSVRVNLHRGVKLLRERLTAARGHDA